MEDESPKVETVSASEAKPVSVLCKLLRSPLAFSLMAAFLTLAVFEAVFILLLSADVMNADRSAHRELQLLRLTGQVSEGMRTGKKLRSTSLKAFSHPEKPNWRPAYQSVYRELHQNIFELRESYLHAGLDPGKMTPSLVGLKSLNDLLCSFQPGSERSLQNRATYEQDWIQFFNSILKDLKYLHKVISGAKGSTLVFGCSPVQLLVGSAAFNILFASIIMMLVHRRITHPITVLSRDCARISKAELMTRPGRVTDEIGALQRSFYDMSVLVSVNEKARRNFLEILQSVQIFTLEKVRASLAPVAALETLAPRARQRCQTLSETLSGLVQLLNSMTEALRAGDSEKITPSYGRTDSRKLLSTALASVEALLLSGKISAKSEVAAEELECDEQLIGRVLVNLLSNAIKFSAEGSVVIAGCSKTSGGLRFYVKDSGPGISPAEKTKLFKRFSQLSSPDGVRRRGHGLGLNICKQIVEVHGGEIGCESEVGKGSTFWFVLPPARLPSGSGDAPAPAATSATTAVAALSCEGTAKSFSPSRGKGAGRLTGIKAGFALLLSIFVVTQSLLAVTLFSGFNEASARAAVYARKKEVLQGVQEYLIRFLDWAYSMERLRNKLELSASEFSARDFAQVMSMIPPMKKRMALADQIIKLEPDSQVARMMKIIWHRDRAALQRVTLGLQSASGDPSHLLSLGNEIKDLLDPTDEEMFKAITVEKEDIESAFLHSAGLRSQILVALVAAGALDILLLAVITALGLSIIKKVAVLQAKAADLACGALLQKTLRGDDELSVLDERICEVSASIKEAEARRQSLLSVISHDLATPLSSVLTGLGMLCQGLYQAIPEAELSLLKQSELDLKKLLQQTYDLLMIEKIDSGTLSPRKDTHELTKILQASFKKYRTLSESRQVSLVEELEGLTGIMVFVDIQLFERLIEIFLENGMQAAPAGSSLQAGGYCRDGQVTVYVKDSGAGISEALEGQIFERFRFIDGKPITGLGLPLASRLVKIANGELRLTSARHEGTRAEVCLPMAEPSAPLSPA